MTTSQSLEPLLSLLYEAAEHDVAWTPFLSSLCEATGTDNGALIIHDLVTSKTEVSWCHFSAQEVKRYQETYASLNPWLPSPGHVAPAGIVVRTESALPLNEFRQTRFYKEWGKQNNVVYGVAVNLGIQDNRFSYLGVNNGEKRGPIPDAAIERLSALTPHLQRVLRLQSDRLRVGTLKAALDQTVGAVCLVGNTGVLLDCTPSATQFINERRVLGLSRNRVLQLTNRTRQQEFEKALRDAPTKRYQVLRLDSGLLGIVTMVQHGALSASGIDQIRMFTILEDSVNSRSAEVFGPLLGLSAAETRLVVALLDRESLSSAAAHLGISRETAKTQLNRIFFKTGTNKQAALFRLFSSLAVINRLSQPIAD